MADLDNKSISYEDLAATYDQMLQSGYVGRPLEIEGLAADYTFKQGDLLVLNGVLYRCTSSTANTPFTLLVQDGKLLYNTVNGQKCYMVSSMTLNAGWTKVCDIDDKFYVEQRLDTVQRSLNHLYLTCTTAASTAAKTVYYQGFILATNRIISVLFTSANTAQNATLNISNTGAKPLRILGQQVQPGLIRPRTILTLHYDGTAYNIVGMTGLEQSQAPDSLVVDMGLPSGLLWAIANLDATTQSGFAEVDGKPSPFKYECSFFSWGNTEPHNPISESAFSYDWGAANDDLYAQTSGSKLTANIAPSQDAARANLGAPWRMPTTEEFKELFDNVNFVQADGTTVISPSTANKLVTVNDVVGIYLKSKINGNLLFFPCSGFGGGSSWSSRGSYGYYLSSSLYSATHGQCLNFYSGGVYPQNSLSRFYGFPIRPVM